jgi:hypothetical protein
MALLLAVVLAGGPTLLDRCLISCHDEPASQSTVPPCHEHQASDDGLSVYGVSACGHDHESLPADTTASDARVSSVRSLAAFAVAPVICVLEPPPATFVALSADLFVHSSAYSPTLVQLRV